MVLFHLATRSSSLVVALSCLPGHGHLNTQMDTSVPDAASGGSAYNSVSSASGIAECCCAQVWHGGRGKGHARGRQAAADPHTQAAGPEAAPQCCHRGELPQLGGSAECVLLAVSVPARVCSVLWTALQGLERHGMPSACKPAGDLASHACSCTPAPTCAELVQPTGDGAHLIPVCRSQLAQFPRLCLPTTWQDSMHLHQWCWGPSWLSLQHTQEPEGGGRSAPIPTSATMHPHVCSCAGRRGLGGPCRVGAQQEARPQNGQNRHAGAVGHHHHLWGRGDGHPGAFPVSAPQLGARRSRYR